MCGLLPSDGLKTSGYFLTFGTHGLHVLSKPFRAFSVNNEVKIREGLPGKEFLKMHFKKIKLYLYLI